MATNLFMRRLILLGTPLILAILEFWHPLLPTRANANWWMTLHILQVPLFGLLALSVFKLTEGLSGGMVILSRWFTGVFVVFYVAFDAIVGISSGLVYMTLNQLPGSFESAFVPLALPLVMTIGNFGMGIIGSLAWLIAMIATIVVLYRTQQLRWPLVLLSISTALFAYNHQPEEIGGIIFPFGTVAMTLFFIGVAWLEFADQGSRQAQRA